nr:hypothetical protein Iba_chr01eCG6790 [Ipomoea batatas]
MRRRRSSEIPAYLDTISGFRADRSREEQSETLSFLVSPSHLSQLDHGLFLVKGIQFVKLHHIISILGRRRRSRRRSFVGNISDEFDWDEGVEKQTGRVVKAAKETRWQSPTLLSLRKSKIGDYSEDSTPGLNGVIIRLLGFLGAGLFTPAKNRRLESQIRNHGGEIRGATVGKLGLKSQIFADLNRSALEDLLQKKCRIGSEVAGVLKQRNKDVILRLIGDEGARMIIEMTKVDRRR